MNTINNLLILGLSILIINGCKPAETTLRFEILSEKSTSWKEQKELKYLDKAFIVNGYIDNEHAKAQIDSFAKNEGEKVKNLYYSVNLDFYRYSEVTNIKNLNKNPRELDRYSSIHDYVFRYKWVRGKFSKKYSFEDGEIVGQNDIYVSSPPDQK